MNSLASEIKTSCVGCCHAEYANGTQLPHCSVGRLEKFIQLGNAKRSEYQYDNGAYHIDRVCNLRGVDDTPNEQARDVIACKFGIAIYDMDNTVSDEAIQSLSAIDYYRGRSKWFYSLISNHPTRTGSLMHYVNTLHAKGIVGEFKMSLRFDGQDLIDKQLFSSLAKHKCTYLVKANHDQPIPSSLLSIVDKSLNDELEQIILYECDGIYVFPFWLINNEYLNYNNIDGFIEAMKEATVDEGFYKQL